MKFKNSIIIGAFLILTICNITCNVKCYAQLNYTELNTIETQLFNQNFNNESTSQRLDRIENTMFGKTSNEPESNRLNRLINLLNSYKQSKNLANQEVSPNERYSEQSFNRNNGYSGT